MGLGIYEVVLLFVLVLFVFAIVWIRALVDILKSNFKDNNKIIWLLVVIFIPLIGVILYFAIGKKQKLPQV